VAKVSDTRDSRGNSINVLAKAGAVLDALDAAGEMTPSALAEQLGEPRSSMYRLLASLEDLGFVAPGLSRGTFQLGMKLYRLGNSAVRHRDLRAAALPTMLELRDATESTVFLAIRSGLEVLCIERLEGRVVVMNALLPGTTAPMHIGAVGQVLLAAEPPEVWEEYCARGPLQAFTPRSITTKEEHFPTLERVRADGVSYSDEDRLLGMAGVGAPIRDHDGEVCGALAFSGPRPLVLGDRTEASVQQIRAAADEISRALGLEHV
jgi:DNA-binding IclR family transcriptional regulator